METMNFSLKASYSNRKTRYHMMIMIHMMMTVVLSMRPRIEPFGFHGVAPTSEPGVRFLLLPSSPLE